MTYKRWSISLLVVIALLLGAAPSAWMQGKVQVTLGTLDQADFPIMHLPVTVLNDHGVPVPELVKDDFEALEDDSPIDIQNVETLINTDLTVAVALVLDISGSVPIEEVRNAANQFLNYLEGLGASSRVALIAFNAPVEIDTFEPDKEVPFTSNLGEVRAVVDGLTGGGGSAVYEAIYKGVRITAAERADRWAVIVMTDGHDTISGYDVASRPHIATADTPKERAKEWEIPIFTVGVGIQNPGSDPDYLKVLAFETGGQYQEASNLDQLGVLFQEVAEQLRTEYRLTFQTGMGRDGKDHVLKIRAITSQGMGEVERTVTYPGPPPIPDVDRLQRDVNGDLEDVGEGAELRGRVLLVPQIEAENPVARVEYYVDGLQVYLADVETLRGEEQHKAWEWEWNTCSVVEGDHSLDIIAYDDAGNASERFSLGVRTTRSPWCVITENIEWVIVIVAAIVLVALVLFLVLRRRGERCPTCGRVMDPSWGGVCQFCVVPVSTGPSTISAPPLEPPTMPPPVPPQPEYRPTAVVGPAGVVSGPASAGGAVVPQVAKTERLRREPQAMGWLVMEQGPRAGQEFRLQEVTGIGRSGENDIIVDDTSVSRQHAKVRLEGQAFTIFDLGATNPTKVNGQEIGKHQLIDGDRVEIGKAVFVFKQVKSPQA